MEDPWVDGQPARQQEPVPGNHTITTEANLLLTMYAHSNPHRQTPKEFKFEQTIKTQANSTAGWAGLAWWSQFNSQNQITPMMTRVPCSAVKWEGTQNSHAPAVAYSSSY